MQMAPPFVEGPCSLMSPIKFIFLLGDGVEGVSSRFECNSLSFSVRVKCI